MKNHPVKDLRVALLAVLVGLLVSANAAASKLVPWATPYYTYTVQKDIVYGQGVVNDGAGAANLKLDLYIPDVPVSEGATATRHALMLMIHGGGFQSGSKTDSNLVASAKEYVQRGWLVASINYRLESSNPVPSSRVQALMDYFGSASSIPQVRAMIAATDDTLTALDFLQARGDVIPAWTALWGHSAGAVTALTTGYSLDDQGIVRPPVAAVLSLAGGIYTAIGTPFDDPTGSDPVLMVIHGTNDATVPFSSATQMQDWAIAAGLPLDFQPVVGGGHSLNVLNTDASTGVTLFQRSVDFLHETVFAGLQQGPQPPGC
ncbi:MAG TPA: alpha/beta hydrolase [Halioglobus sp.]